MTFLSQGANLRGANQWNITPSRATYDEDEEFYVIGDRVLVDGCRPGSVAYFGETEFGAGDWVGVVLDEPTGNHAGKLHGREYFQCDQNHGIFVRAHRVSQLLVGSKSRVGGPSWRGAASRTPTPTYNQLLGGGGGGGNRWWNVPVTPQPPSRCGSSKSPASSSLLDSYYYDDDYRQDRGPTIASLAQKLKSIDEQRQRPDRSSTPAGILKHHNSRWSRQPATGGGGGGAIDETGEPRWGSRSDSRSSGLGSSQRDLSTSMSSRLDDLDRRLRASSVSPGVAARRSMFSFRPKREPLAVGLDNTTSKQVRPLDDDDDNCPTLSMYDANQDHTPTSARVNFSRELAKLGDQVWVRTERDARELTGVLRFMGETEFATGEWAGVELEERVGKNDGSILGHRYFTCPQGYGLFVPALRVRRCTSADSATLTNHPSKHREPNSFDSMRSTILSPPPPPQPPRRRYDSSSATPSSCLSSPSPYGSKSFDRLSSSSSPSPLSGAEADPDRWRHLSGTREQPPPVRTYVSRATSISPLLDGRESAAILERHYNRRAKFDDRDLERELARSSASASAPTAATKLRASPRAKAVTYTFITNKLDGNPIAKRTLVYE